MENNGNELVSSCGDLFFVLGGGGMPMLRHACVLFKATFSGGQGWWSNSDFDTWICLQHRNRSPNNSYQFLSGLAEQVNPSFMFASPKRNSGSESWLAFWVSPLPSCQRCLTGAYEAIAVEGPHDHLGQVAQSLVSNVCVCLLLSGTPFGVASKENHPSTFCCFSW